MIKVLKRCNLFALKTNFYGYFFGQKNKAGPLYIDLTDKVLHIL
jgi:hypothetical protein